MEYQDLEVWKESKELVKLVYNFTNKLPVSEQFGLSLQIRRSSISIPSNIAEGIGRNHSKDTLQFLYIARGSLYEVETQVTISKELFNLDDAEFVIIINKIKECKRILNGFINYYKSKN